MVYHRVWCARFGSTYIIGYGWFAKALAWITKSGGGRDGQDCQAWRRLLCTHGHSTKRRAKPPREQPDPTLRLGHDERMGAKPRMFLFLMMLSHQLFEGRSNFFIPLIALYSIQAV